jgi:TolB-like protein
VNRPDATAIRGQLQRILASDGFRDESVLGPILRHLVESTLAGDALREPAGATDADRIRTLLRNYYRSNPTDSIVISLPAGDSIPVVESIPKPRRPRPDPEDVPMRFHMTGPALVFIMITVMSFGIGLFLYLGSISKRQTKPAIAVLPFRPLNADAEAQTFGDGVTIELIDTLTRIENLTVVSWNSASTYRGKAGSLAELRGKLNAAAVLDGSVRKDGNRLRVTAKLVDTAKGTTIWSQDWDREVKDVFRIQEEIVKSVVFGLRVPMSADPDQLYFPRQARNLDAYADYLMARVRRSQFSRANLDQSCSYARKAIEGDPAYAPPRALLAFNLALAGYLDPAAAGATAREAKEVATKAIELDPGSAEAHAALGLVLSMGEWKFGEADTHFRKAIALNPGSAEARSAYALGYLLPVARLTEADVEARRALAWDPLSFLSNFTMGQVSLQTPGQESEAARELDRAIELGAGWSRPVQDRRFASVLSGRKDEAAKACVGCTSFDRARMFALAGDVESAMRELQQAYDSGDRQLMFLRVDRGLTNLRGDPRFQSLMRKIGLP